MGLDYRVSTGGARYLSEVTLKLYGKMIEPSIFYLKEKHLTEGTAHAKTVEQGSAQ